MDTEEDGSATNILMDAKTDTKTEEPLIKLISCKELDSNSYDLEYLIKDILVAKQPCVLGGPKKALKTSIAVDLGISLATMRAKASVIRKGLDLMPLDPDWCLPSRLEDNPLVWMLKVNGIIMDIRMAPREAQVEAYEQGLIPYIPEDRREAIEDDAEELSPVNHLSIICT